MIKHLLLLIFVIKTISVFSQNLDSRTEKGMDLLYYTDLGVKDSVKSLIFSGVNPDFTNEDGVTAIMLASQAGYDDIVDFLIRSGADINKKSEYYGISPLISAVRNDYLRTAEILIRNGANINDNDNWGRQAIHYAAMEGFLATTDMLIYYDAEINDQDAFGITPIMYAVNNKKDSVTDLLFSYGADLFVKTTEGNTLLHLASIEGNDYFASKYFEYFEYYPLLNNDSLTPVELSIIHGNHKVLEVFLENQHLPRDTIHNIYTPLTLAKHSKNFRTRRIIRKMDYEDIHYPYFRKIGMGYDIIFNSNEFFYGLNIAISEDRYGWVAAMGFITRGSDRAVFVKKSANEFYQLQEKRYGAYIKLQKHFNFIRFSNNSYTSIFAQIKPIYTWGEYEGVNKTIVSDIIASPGIGISFNFGQIFRMSLSYEYTDMNIYSIKPNQWNIGAKILIPFRKNEIDEKHQYIINY